MARAHTFSLFGIRTTHNAQPTTRTFSNVQHVDPRPVKNWGPRVARVTRARHTRVDRARGVPEGPSRMTYTLDYGVRFIIKVVHHL